MGSVVQWVGSWMARTRAVVTTTPAGDHSASCAVNAVVSILMPGPWVVEMVTDRMYVPLAVAGLSFISISSSAVRLVASCSGLNDALPIGLWMMPAFST